MILRAVRQHLFFVFVLSFTGVLIAAEQLSSVEVEFDQLRKEFRYLEDKLANTDIALEEMPLAEINIREVLESVMQKISTPSEMLKNCYQKVCGGETLTIGEVMAIMPELIECAKQEVLRSDGDRAPRPDATGVNAGNAIVGKNGCDLTQVLGLLAAIKKRIQQLQEIICDKFMQTWTILESLRCCCPTTLITEATTIASPGNYLLANDIIGTIFIESDNVNLNLCDHSVGGDDIAILVSGFENILIENGRLTNYVSNGIVVSDARNITFRDLAFSDGQVGALINTSTCINFQNCVFQELTLSAIAGEDSDTIIAKNIKAQQNNGAALSLISLERINNILIKSYLATINSSSFFQALDLASCSDVQLQDLFIANNLGSSDLDAITFSDVRKAQLLNIYIGDNQAGENVSLVTGLNIGNSQDIYLENVQVKHLASAESATGILVNTSFNVQLKNCITSNIIGSGPITGFDNIASKEVLYDHCLSTSSVASGSTASGFAASDAIKAIYTQCISNNHIADTIATGFLIDNSSNACVLGCIAKENTGDVDGIGFDLIDCVNCAFENNISSVNIGGVSSIGVRIANGGGLGVLSSLVTANQSINHGATNFVISPGIIPTIVYIRDPLFISASPTPVDNLDVN